MTCDLQPPAMRTNRLSFMLMLGGMTSARAVDCGWTVGPLPVPVPVLRGVGRWGLCDASGAASIEKKDESLLRNDIVMHRHFFRFTQALHSLLPLG